MTKFSIAVLAVLSLAGSLAAQSDIQLVVSVPFGFELADRSLPAGDYRVSTGPRGIVWIRTADLKTTLSVTAHAAQSAKAPVYGLTFNRYDDRYFLSKVWMGGSNGQEIPRSRAEHEQVRARLVAKAAPQVVTILARQMVPVRTP